MRRWLLRSQTYHLRSRWSVSAPIENVASVFRDPSFLPRWWPQFLESETVGQNLTSPDQIAFRVVTKGWLPYRLRFRFELAEAYYPEYFCLRARGDFDGYGRGWLRENHDETVIDFDWRIRVCKPLLRRWSFLLKPMFIHNHRWLMRQGQRNLISLVCP